MDADPHQARHWFVTNAMRNIQRTCRTEPEIRRERMNLIAYMGWRAGEQTLACYEHVSSSSGFARRIASIHRVIATQERELAKGRGNRRARDVAPPQTEIDEDLKFILGGE